MKKSQDDDRECEIRRLNWALVKLVLMRDFEWDLGTTLATSFAVDSI